MNGPGTPWAAALLVAFAGCSEGATDSTAAVAVTSSVEADPVPGELAVTYPPEGAAFPRDIVAPTIRWMDTTDSVVRWDVKIGRAGGPALAEGAVSTDRWRPSPAQWNAVKAAAVGESVVIAIRGYANGDGEPQSQGTVTVGISTDEVAAPILYRDVILPFRTANRRLNEIRWRLGWPDGEDEPEIVMSDIAVCANCHTVSEDGKTYGMNVHFAHTERSLYAMTSVDDEIVLDRDTAIHWADLKPEDESYRTAALLTELSPDGRYAVTTGEDMTTILNEPTNLAYSFSAFFTFQGVLVIHDTRTKEIWRLPGADDRRYVHTNPTWSPDGSYLVFSRARALSLPNVNTKENAFYKDREQIERALEERGGFRYDLYRIPFNDGEGGVAEPIDGAAHNGMSNFFPVISPDGKWLVFTQAKRFNLLQPDSKLYIVSTAGGQPREMSCNTREFNSWHSFSPNGRWMVFSSKARGPYTQLYLTHIDDEGRDTPAIELERFAIPNRAANIPVFANVERGQLRRISTAD